MSSESPRAEARLTGPRGEIVIAIVRPGVILITSRGHISRELAGPLREHLRDMVRAAPRSLVFNDAWEADSYDSDVRTKLTDYLASPEARERIPEIHVAARSKLVRMGLSVARLLLDDRLRSHASREELTRALDRADPAATGS